MSPLSIIFRNGITTNVRPPSSVLCLFFYLFIQYGSSLFTILFMIVSSLIMPDHTHTGTYTHVNETHRTSSTTEIRLRTYFSSSLGSLQDLPVVRSIVLVVNVTGPFFKPHKLLIVSPNNRISPNHSLEHDSQIIHLKLRLFLHSYFRPLVNKRLG